jgi:glycosyltransferase involved in cell wall biosynthesis
MPKVSVILAARNAEENIARTIESVLAQSLSDWELIIVDDGSHDSFAEICDSYAEKDSRIKVLRQGAAGISIARNKGIKEAKGDYIGFIDADTYALPEMFSTMLKWAEDESADIVQCGYFVVAANTFTPPYPTSQSMVTGYNKRVWLYEDLVSAEDFLKNLAQRKTGETCNLLIKKGICKSTQFTGHTWQSSLYNLDIAAKSKKFQILADCLFIRLSDDATEPTLTAPSSLEHMLYLQRLFK